MDYFLEQDRRELHPDADDLARIAELREAAVAAPAPPVRGRPFAKGRSGNPAGKRRGTRNKATLLAETILYEQAGPVMSSTVETAKSGNVLAQKVCVERLLAPRRERFLAFEMPPIETAADLAPAMGAVMAALAAGEITPGEAERITNTALGWMRAIEISNLTVQLQELRKELGK